MNKFYSLIALLLASLMILGMLASCTFPSSGNDEAESGSIIESSTETNDLENDSQSEPSKETDEKENSTSTESDANSGPEQNTETESEVNGPTIERGDVLPVVENANALANGVQAYFSDAKRTAMTFENLNMSLEYALSSTQPQLVKALKNKSGNSYVENTMDVFITMKNGKTYYGSKTNYPTSANIYRFGYYFYEMRFEDQSFAGDFVINDQRKVSYNQLHKANDVDDYRMEGKNLCITNSIEGTDPYVIFGEKYLNYSFPAEKYQFLKLTLTADESAATSAAMYFVVGDKTNFTADQVVPFTISNDNQPHEYLIPLTSIKGYEGAIKGIRLDVSGAGAQYKVGGMELLSVELDGAPENLGIARVFNTYSDKLHQVLQVAASETTADIESIGFVTDINADTVTSVIIVNKDGSTLTSAADVTDWASVCAVGFDIKDAGIFGYILPYDGKSGTLNITLNDGVYRVTQSHCPENGTIIPSRGSYNHEKGYYESVVPYNQNDFYMGNRIYTNESHSFEDFLYEAYCETHPLSDKNFSVSVSSTDSEYLGYDALRGIYKFSIAGHNSFNDPYYSVNNKHFNSTFSVRGDNYSRRIYVMTATPGGALECAVLLDEDSMLLPVPMEVGKNFSEAGGERNLFNINDETYGETIFPIVVDAKLKYTYSVINLYQNWGRFPLKQISWIQFYAPYYHLSTGVTESNCILPWYTTKNSKSLNTLPDFRSMSAPEWDNQPQHNSCGVHMWLYYNDADGMQNVTSENTLDLIDSYGPTYADVKMDYLSDDGKMKLSYVHSEMPQTDENRTFYEIKYEVLEDITINDFKNNFRFYSVYPNNPTGNYTKIGYLDKDNNYQVTDSVATVNVDENGKVSSTFGEDKYYVLGDECPYFSFFDMDGADPNHQSGYANVALLIYNYEFIIGGEECDANFIIKNTQRKVMLSLDLGDVTLKKGDTFSINAILLPWGSQELEDGIIDADAQNFEYDMKLSDGKLYMDKNVRDVRENTLLDPIKVIAGENTKVIESVFIPKVRSTNGKTAEFTVSGGHNNIAVRVYGFDKLTAPVIEEYVDGKWVEYVVNSSETPDSKGYLHYYDGYMVHYDGNGEYSYSFVFSMENGESRRFRLAAEKDFEGWQRDPVIEEEREDLLDVYLDPQEIYDITSKDVWVSDAVISEDKSFVSLFGTGADALNANGKPVAEGYFNGYKKDTATPESGHLFIVKYRIPTTNQRSIDKFEVFMSTIEVKATENNKFTVTNVENDGEWHVIVVDLSKVTKEGFADKEFVPDGEGKYYAKFLRFDFFDKWMNTTDYIDIAYVGIENDLQTVIDLLMFEEHNTVKTATLIEGTKNLEINVSSGNIVDNSAPKLDSFIHPDCPEYTPSNLDYAACVDGINGKTLGGGANSKNMASNNINAEPITLQYNGKTIAAYNETNCTAFNGPYLVISGWVVADGGVSKYVFSVDGGKTWQDCEGFGLTPGAVSDAHLPNAANRIGKKDNSPFTTEDDKQGGLFQGLNAVTPKGIAADLSDYVGKTVHVIFAAVPAGDTSTLCLISYVTGVKVVSDENTEIPPENEPAFNDYIKEGSGYTASKLEFAACIDRIHNKAFGAHVNSNKPDPLILDFNATAISAYESTTNYATTPGNYLVFSGWAIIRGGIDRYVWSVDGGLTWNTAEAYGNNGAVDISDAIIAHDRLKGLGYTFTKEADGAYCMFQAPNDRSIVKGMAANLSNYSGSTVDVIFAAVPKSDTSTLRIIAIAKGVQVP